MNQQKIKQQLKFVFYIFATLILIEALNLITGRVFNQYSIVPRDFSSLVFILSAPFLHANVQHFISNILTLCVFAFFLLQFGHKRFVIVSISLVVGTGLLVWLFGRHAFHLGASGVIYGYFGYLLLAGLLSKKVSLTLISLGIGFFYGAMVWGVLPSQPYISWESHLFGFLVGLVLAFTMRNKATN